MAKFNDYLKTAILIFIIIQIGPPALHNLKEQWLESLEPHNKVGLIKMCGSIDDCSSYSKYLKMYFQDPSIKAILIKIESSGGASGTTQALFHEIEELKKEHPKPIVAYTENMCASGAYYIASATDHIVTTGSAIIGSIGSRIVPIFKVKALMAEWNVSCESISAGKYKDTFSPFTDMTPEQKAMMESIAQNSYQQFANDVASKRHLQISKMDQWADGKIFTGQQAYDIKLVDSVGSIKTAIEFIKKNIIPSNRKIEWVEPPTRSKLDKFLNSLSDYESSPTNSSMITQIMASVTAWLQKNS